MVKGGKEDAFFCFSNGLLPLFLNAPSHAPYIMVGKRKFSAMSSESYAPGSKRRRYRAIQRGRPRARRSQAYTVSVSRQLGVSAAQFVPLKYSFSYTTNIASPTNISYTYSGNDLYAVNGTGGVNPAGFDQWATLYSRYVCSMSSCKIQVTNLGTNVPEVCLAPMSNTSLTDFDTLSSQPGAVSKTITSAAGNGTLFLASKMTTASLFGESPFTSDRFSAAVNASPSAEWGWAIGFKDSYGINIGVSFVITGEIVYWVKFYARKTPVDA